MTNEPKTLAEALDEAKNGEEFGQILMEALSRLERESGHLGDRKKETK